MLAIKRERGGREVGDRGCRRQSFAPADNRPAPPSEIQPSTAATRCKAQPQPPSPPSEIQSRQPSYLLGSAATPGSYRAPAIIRSMGDGWGG